jgi:hypothetical protein
MTARDIIMKAFKMNSINTPTDQQLSNGLILLNNMISSWFAEGLMVPYITLEEFALTIGKSVYSIGDGGEFDTIRPTRIIGGFIRDSENRDYPVVTTMNRWEYDAL